MEQQTAETKWHLIENYDANLSHEANVERGVDLPENGRSILVTYPYVSTDVYASNKTVDDGIWGTKYHDGMMWAYFDMPTDHQMLAKARQARERSIGGRFHD